MWYLNIFHGITVIFETITVKPSRFMTMNVLITNKFAAEERVQVRDREALFRHTDTKLILNSPR